MQTVTYQNGFGEIVEATFLTAFIENATLCLVVRQPRNHSGPADLIEADEVLDWNGLELYIGLVCTASGQIYNTDVFRNHDFAYDSYVILNEELRAKGTDLALTQWRAVFNQTQFMEQFA